MTAKPTPKSVPPEAAVELATVAELLADLLERETAHVQKMQIAEIGPLQAEKSQLTLRFQKAVTALGGDGIAALGGAARTRWLAAGRRLTTAATANERALRIGRIATERLVGAVVSAVRQSRQHPAAYSARRAASPEPPVAGIAVDHRL